MRAKRGNRYNPSFPAAVRTEFVGCRCPDRRPDMFAHLIPGPGFISRAVQEFRLKRDVGALAALDDRALADLGLSRGGVESAIRSGRPPRRLVRE
jgi:uncharacterized protein YjiS (DUF1127 family)